MSEELLQRPTPEKIGKWDFYNIGATSLKQLKEAGIVNCPVLLAQGVLTPLYFEEPQLSDGVRSSLLLYVFLDYLFVTSSTYRGKIITIRPKLPSP